MSKRLAPLIEAVEAIASTYDVPAAVIEAVAMVESNGRPFATVEGRRVPLIRIEGHYFWRLLPEHKRAAARRAGLAHPKMGRVKNPRSQAKRYAMLARMVAIDAEAAVSSCSWGVGQVMGSHWRKLGFPSARAFMEHAIGSVAGQVDLMMRYCRKFGLLDELRALDWHGFARGYNGPRYRKFGYAKKMARAYRRITGKPGRRTSLPGVLRMGASGAAVRELQRLLVRAGYALDVDGDFGPATRAAVRAFQKTQGLVVDGLVGPRTQDALAALKASPDERLDRVVVGKVEEVRRGTKAIVGGVAIDQAIGAAKDQVEAAAAKAAGLPGTEQIVTYLGYAGVALAVAGAVYALFGIWRATRTDEADEGFVEASEFEPDAGFALLGAAPFADQT